MENPGLGPEIAAIYRGMWGHCREIQNRNTDKYRIQKYRNTEQTLAQFIEECEDTTITITTGSKQADIGQEIVTMVMTALIIIFKMKIINIIIILTTIILAGGKPVDASQEMVALGICNILGSFVQAMPTTGSFSRFIKKRTSQEFRKLPYTSYLKSQV